MAKPFLHKGTKPEYFSSTAGQQDARVKTEYRDTEQGGSTSAEFALLGGSFSHISTSQERPLISPSTFFPGRYCFKSRGI